MNPREPKLYNNHNWISSDQPSYRRQRVLIEYESRQEQDLKEKKKRVNRALRHVEESSQFLRHYDALPDNSNISLHF